MDVEKRYGVVQMTLKHYEQDFADRHMLDEVLAKWASEKPDEIAIINADTGVEVTWKRFEQVTTALAVKLMTMGFEKGDFFATSLPFLTEHVFLHYACMKIGVILVPLDLRLKAAEVIRSLCLVKPKGYAFLGKTEHADFRELAKAVRVECPFIEYFVQFSAPDETLPDALNAFVLAAEAEALAKAEDAKPGGSELLDEFTMRGMDLDEHDGALVIFTTGSTGYPKPALLSHRAITCQNMCLGAAFDFEKTRRMLVNLPPSHVGGQTEQLMTAVFWGRTAVLLHVFDPAKSLAAIQKYEIDAFGQIPALFNLEWRLPDYDSYDLSSLKFALYGGQAVTRVFLEKLSTMAEGFGTGLGLTETAGFCTYSPLDGTVDDILAGVGVDMPVYPISVRKPMKGDGSAGEKLPDGETGHICFSGPQTFLGYVGDPQATAKTLSSDGVLYTGDLGFVDEKGLHFAGRAKHVIKPKGYQIFPVQVEDHFQGLKDKVGMVGVVGVEHDVFSEGIVCFVEKKPGAELSVEELHEHSKELASYMRPQHFILLEPGQFPLNRVAKTDYVHLKQRAEEEVKALREKGGWDR